MPQEPLTKAEFTNRSASELREIAQVGEPNTVRQIKVALQRNALGDSTNFIILDVLGRVWLIPKIQDRYGRPDTRVDDPLALHFGADGQVTHAVHLHRYYDETKPLSPEEEALSRMMNTKPANAGNDERYEGDGLA